jgi:hypothetical protein
MAALILTMDQSDGFNSKSIALISFGLTFKIEKILMEVSFQLSRDGKESKSIKKANHFFFSEF